MRAIATFIAAIEKSDEMMQHAQRLPHHHHAWGDRQRDLSRARVRTAQRLVALRAFSLLA
jgi:hypothetical protein